MKKILSCIYLLLFLSISLNAQSTDSTSSTLVIGIFKVTKVIDGDTFRFDKLDRSSRLVGIDTEETFKGADAEQKNFEIGKLWESFYKSERGDSRMPVKTDSPMGYEAWKWAEKFFEKVDRVRLEIDEPERVLDIYDRYLAYVIAIMKDGTEINYNIEAVKQGYSPYFNKYGNSKRFHKEFVEAQEYAMKNKLGIWNPGKKAYPDYDERLIWWNKRAEQLENFEKKYSGNPNYLNLNHEKDFDRLKDFAGKEVIVFGSISEILKNKTPYLIRIPHNRVKTFDVVVYVEYISLIDELDLDYQKEFYTYFKGKIEPYKGRFQMVLRNKDQFRVE
jgi:endonuclease YncB( thermonuclease family)